MKAICDNLTNAKRLAVTVGIKKAWCIQFTDGQHFVVSDVYGQQGSGRRFHLTDDDAIELARKAGVQCDDDGLFASSSAIVPSPIRTDTSGFVLALTGFVPAHT